MNPKPLQRRPKTFAEKIAQGHSATDAYILAGYKPAKRETAHRAASRLYRTPAVRTYIQELRRTGDELAREETSLTIAQKLTFLTRLVLTSSATLREDDPLIQSHRLLKDGTTSIRMPCKLKALKMHSELAGHSIPKPTAHAEPADLVQQLFDQIRQALGNPARHPQNSGPVATPPPNPCNPPPSASPPEAPTEKPPLLKNRLPTPTPNTPPAQKSTPQQTTTKPCDVAPQPSAPPRTPADLRRLVQAQIRQSSPLYQTTLSPPSYPLDHKEPPATLRS